MMTNEKPARPDEVPFYPEKPEITPGEPEPAVWPKKDPEIIPGKEPERQSPPKEIPPPPESIDKN